MVMHSNKIYYNLSYTFIMWETLQLVLDACTEALSVLAL